MIGIKLNRQKMIIIGLAVTLFLVSQYVVFDIWQETKHQENLKIFEMGYENGITDAVTAIFNNTEDCLTTSITVGNLTKHVLDISCLKVNSDLNP